jgi:hypothetical protein
MSDVMLSVAYQSLGKILAQLSESPEIQASPELSARIRNAQLFHQQMADELQEMLRENHSLRETVSELTRETDERVCGRPSTSRFARYEAMRDAGSDPQEVYLAARNDKLDEIETIRTLRHVFHLSLSEAEEAMAEAESELHHVK